MDNIIKEGEQMLDGQGGNSNNQSQGNMQQNQGGSNNSSGGGGFMKGMEQNTEDAYVNNTVNGFLTKEGVPGMADGAIDGVIDTELNKYQKDL